MLVFLLLVMATVFCMPLHIGKVQKPTSYIVKKTNTYEQFCLAVRLLLRMELISSKTQVLKSFCESKLYL